MHTHSSMTMDKWISTGLLMIAVVLSVETNKTEVQSNRSVWVGVEVNHNSSDEWCEVPGQPLNGGYRSEGDADGHRYNTGDTITYYCNRGHEVIGQANRTCNGTPNGWQPHEPYCQPEYIGHLMRRLSGIEDEIRVIGQRITTIENHVTATDNRAAVINCTPSSIENNMKLYSSQMDRERLEACTDITKPIDEDTVTKCKTMQTGVRNGRSVSVYTWVIPDYNNKIPQSDSVTHHSQPFYHTVPGYKFRLKGYIFSDSDIWIYLQLLPGEYDDQLKWPFSQKHDVTVLTNTGLEAPHKKFSGGWSTCHLNRPTSPTDVLCIDDDDVYLNKKHILSDGSVVAKLYFYK